MIFEWDENKNLINMRKEYDIKKQVTINLDESIITYFKEKAESTGIPYQTLINLYLKDCVKHNRNLEISWN